MNRSKNLNLKSLEVKKLKTDFTYITTKMATVKAATPRIIGKKDILRKKLPSITATKTVPRIS